MFLFLGNFTCVLFFILYSLKGQFSIRAFGYCILHLRRPGKKKLSRIHALDSEMVTNQDGVTRAAKYVRNP
uniref:Uncharacterized protein n=1 Tax=Physcomitrium patens TaxID=3218 RepID=A0A7I3ZD23_PHYPA